MSNRTLKEIGLSLITFLLVSFSFVTSNYAAPIFDLGQAKPFTGRQKIVEIVGDAARQLTDRLHLLGLVELRLQVLLLGGIDEVQDQSRNVAVVILHAAGIERGGQFATSDSR